MRLCDRTMDQDEEPRVQSEALAEFAGVSGLDLPQSPHRLNLRHDDSRNGLGRLVLALVKLLHELLERQAIKRIEVGTLTAVQIERLGLTLMRQAQEIDRLRRAFNLEDEDLDIDLGPLGKLF